jgi:hypothetical protein
MTTRSRPDRESARAAAVQKPDTVGCVGDDRGDAPGPPDADGRGVAPATAPEARTLPLGTAGGSDPQAAASRAKTIEMSKRGRVVRNTVAMVAPIQ